MKGHIVCSLAELDAVGDALGLDVRRFPFSIGHRGTTLAERVTLVEAVHRDLVARDLVRGRDFAPELVERLRLFADAPLGVALVGTARGVPLVALAVSDGRDGVLAVQRDELVVFHRHAADTVVEALVGLLPDLPPGPGSAVVVDAPAPLPPDEDFSHFRFTAGIRPAATADSAVAEILRRPRTGAGYFSVSVRKGGQEAELGAASYLDVDAGRFAVLPGRRPNGTPSATYVPMDRWSIGRHLADSLSSTG
ncbi:ESX secretion-associated protein EspG [Saccharothrix texasensis]|uniref:ESAT-6 protein secretion system EspG family protein n=1 Tax=Saccharothrix texasensis TaxID=103734 RepID=A0A3N1HD02_9PSEU|nr:ESX secretion-associated protein EspG [Saccharothrix texasensis]ROP40375.1 ESAT-6 protein secretion system EspG family protein [Saccharothrix texasensis]